MAEYRMISVTLRQLAKKFTKVRNKAHINMSYNGLVGKRSVKCRALLKTTAAVLFRPPQNIRGLLRRFASLRRSC